jgi:WD40 repeat protein
VVSQAQEIEEQGSAAKKQGRRFALVVGVNKAPESAKSILHFAEQDAHDMAETLYQPFCAFDHVVELSGDEAKTESVRDAITDLLPDKDDDDLLLFYFAGHGVQKALSASERDAFLVTANFSSDRASRDPVRYISLSWLRDMFYYRTRAGRVVMILDCCYAGFIANSPLDPEIIETQKLYERYFNLKGDSTMQPVSGLRRIFAAAGADTEIVERDGHGVMTGLMLSALQGKEQSARNDQGEVTLPRLYSFLQERMLKGGVLPLTYLGDDQNRACTLAYHEAPSPQIAPSRPARDYYVPRYLRDIYQERPGEFAEVLRLLKVSPPRPVGLVGMAGIGKSQLAAQFAHRHKDHFKGGVYWVEAAGRSLDDWQHSFAQLARALDYRPSRGVDDEYSLACHIAEYLATTPGALLILDGVEEPEFATRLPPILAGTPLQCAILYTSVSQRKTDEVRTYPVPPLANEQAYQLLLPDARSDVLTALKADRVNDQTQAVKSICTHLGNHPMALEFLRALLIEEPSLAPTDLLTELRHRGILDLAGATPGAYPGNPALLETFQMVWDRIKNANAELLFKLAAFYPDMTAIPLWQPGLAANLAESNSPFSPLRLARKRLNDLSLIDYLPEKHCLQLHPLLREFGRRLVNKSAEDQKGLVDAGNKLATALEDLALLEIHARQDYWTCLDQMRSAISYVDTLTGHSPASLSRLERYLDQESHVLASGGLWPDQLPGLFHQQFHNHAVEDAVSLKERAIDTPWLRQLNRTGASRGIPEERTFGKHRSEVTAVAFSPGNSEILTGSEDRTARLLDTSSGRTLAILAGHEDGVSCVAFSPDGKYLLTGSRDKTLRLWSWEREFYAYQYLYLLPQADEITSAAFSPDGHYILTGSRDRIARVWDRETRNIVCELVGHTGMITGVAFSPDGALALTGAWDNTARLWEWRTNRPPQIFALHVERELDWEHARSIAYLKNAATGARVTDLGILGVEDRRVVECVAFSPTGASILTGSNDATARLWEIASGRLVRTFTGHGDAIASVAFSPDGIRILTGSGDSTARLWEVSTGKELASFKHPGRVKSVAFSSDGEKVLTGANDQLARLWNVPAALVTYRQGRAIASRSPVTCVALAAGAGNSYYALAGAEDGTVQLWNGDAATMRWRPNISWHAHSAAITGIAFSANLRRLLTASGDGRAALWEFDHNRRSAHLTHLYTRHTASLSCALFSPDRESILTASLDGTAHLWKAWPKQGPRHFLSQPPPEIPPSPIECVDFSHDGHWLLVGMNDGGIGLWSATRRMQKRVWRGHSSQVTSVAFLPGDRFLLTSALDCKTCLWNADTGELVTELEEQSEEVILFAFSPSGALLLTCNRRGSQARLWEIDSAQATPRLLLRGTYFTHYPIRAALWLDDRRFILADTGGADCRPYFYHLSIENLRANSL